MSYAAILRSAATQAQSVLAQLGGAAAGANNSQYAGRAYLAVYGQPQTERLLLPAGGERVRTWIMVSATRSQFTAPPQAGQKWTRTDLTPHGTFTIDSVDIQDATVYSLRLVRTGG